MRSSPAWPWRRVVCFVLAFAHWQSSDPVKFACYLIAALLASSLKVSLPGIEGTLSVNFLFTLLGILELSLPETLLIGLASTLGQFYWKPARQVKLVQLVFNWSQVTVSSAVAYGAYKLVVIYVLHAPGPLALLVAAITHFACNTAAMSTIIGLTEDKPISKSLDRQLSLVVSLLHGRSGGGGPGPFSEQAHRMAIVSAGAAADLPDVPLVSSLSWQTGD